MPSTNSKLHKYWRWLDHTTTYADFNKEMWPSLHSSGHNSQRVGPSADILVWVNPARVDDTPAVPTIIDTNLWTQSLGTINCMAEVPFLAYFYPGTSPVL